MTEDERKHFDDHLERATAIVANWPEWKKGILGKKYTTPFDVDLAIKFSKVVHEQCDNVPHDIGVTLAQIVTEHKGVEEG